MYSAQNRFSDTLLMGRKPTLETLYRISLALDVRMSDIVLAIEEALEDRP